MKLLPVFIALLLTLSMAFAMELRCRKGSVAVYEYISESSSFKKKHSKSKKKRKGKTVVVRARVLLTCDKQFKLKQRTINVWTASVRDLEIETSDQKKAKTNKQVVPNDYRRTVTFAQATNGRIYDIIHHHKETNALLHIKKNIVQMFQTKMRGGCAIREGDVGVYRVCYKRAQGKKSAYIKGKFNERSIMIPADKRFSQKNAVYRQTVEAQVRNGYLHTAMQNVTFSGSQLPKKQTKNYKAFKKSGVDYSKGNHADITKKFGPEGPMNSQSFSILKLKHFYNNKKKYRFPAPVYKFVKQAKKQYRLFRKSHKHFKFEGVHKDYKVDGLRFSQSYIDDIEKEKKKMMRKYPFWSELKKYKKKNAKPFSKQTKFEHYLTFINNKKTIRKLYNVCFGKLKQGTNTLKKLRFLRACQSMLAAAQTQRSRHFLLRSMRFHWTLTLNGAQLFLGQDKIGESFPFFLKKLMNKDYLHRFLDRHVSKKRFRRMRHELYLVRAAIVKKLPPHVAKVLVEEYLKHLRKTKNTHALSIVTHALGNMGSAVPLEEVRTLLHHEHQQIAIAAAHGLRNRNKLEENPDVALLIHQGVQNPVLSDAVRSTLVSSALERESAMTTWVEGQSAHHFAAEFVNELARGLDRSNKPNKATMASILEYLQENAHLPHVKKAMHETIGQIFPGEDMFGVEELERTEPQIFGFIKKVFKAICIPCRIKDAIDKVKGAVAALRRAFSKAEFTQTACFRVNRDPGKPMCVHHPDMISFVTDRNKFVPMKNLRDSKYIAFEKLLGARIIHLYVGVVAYAGFTARCGGGKNDGIFANIFKRASVYARVWPFKLNVIEAYAYATLNGREGFKDDYGFVKLGRTVAVSNHLLPYELRKIVDKPTSGEYPLLPEKTKDLFSVTYIIPVAFIPVSVTVKLTGHFDVTLRYDVNLQSGNPLVSLRPEPTFGLSITGEGGFKIFGFIGGGLGLTVGAKYTLVPELALRDCKLCAILSQRIEPFWIRFYLFATAFSWRGEFTLFHWGAPKFQGRLFGYCHNLRQVTHIAPSVIGYRKHQEVNFPGHDILVKAKQTRNQCRDICNKNKHCMGYAYAEKGAHARTCWLKNNFNGGNDVNSHITTYIKSQPDIPGWNKKESTDVDGHVIHHSRGNDVHSCKNRCQGNPSCGGFIYGPAHGDCWEKKMNVLTSNHRFHGGVVAYSKMAHNIHGWDRINRNYPGHDIAVLHHLHPKDCARKCRENVRCAAFTIGLGNLQGNCYLKSLNRHYHNTETDDFVTYFRHIPGQHGYHLRWQFDYHGHDLGHIRGLSYTQCKHHCDRDARCVAYVIGTGKAEGNCWLKNALHPAPGIHSHDRSAYLKNLPQFAGYRHFRDRVSLGHQLRHFKNTSPHRCMELCKHDRKCYAFNIGTGHRVGICDLKAKGPFHQHSLEFSTYVFDEANYHGFTKYTNTNFHGHDIKVHHKVSLDQCRVKCHHTADCNAFTYNKPHRDCYLKTGRGGSAHGTDWDSYVNKNPNFRGWHKSERVNMAGHDFKNFHGLTPTQCKDHCLRESQCTGFVVGRVEDPHLSGRCWLKRGYGHRRGDHRFNYYQLAPQHYHGYEHYPNTVFAGFDLQEFTVGNLYQCRDRCNSHPQCQAFQIRQKDMRCWLKKADGAKFPVLQHDAYVLKWPNAPGFRKEVGIRYHAHTRHYGHHNFEQCRAKCVSDARCRAFAIGRLQENHNCFIQDAASHGRHGHAFITTYTRNMDHVPGYHKHENRDMKGGLVRHMRANLFTCSKVCTETAKCQGFTMGSWGPLHNQCWLKFHTHHMHLHAHTTFYTKINEHRLGYKKLHRINLIGNDIRSLNVHNHDQCIHECNRDHRCQAVTLIGNRCYLKTTDGHRQFNTGATSYYLLWPNYHGYHKFTHKDFPRFDIYHSAHLNPAQCKTKCDHDARCRAFMIGRNSKSHNCWLKHMTLGHGHHNADLTTYRKIMPHMPGYHKNEDTDMPGHDLYHRHHTNAFQCRDLCNRNHHCKAFVVGTGNLHHQCWLKRWGRGHKRHHAEVTTYWK